MRLRIADSTHALRRTLRDTAKLAGSQRKLWVPFLLVMLVECVFLGLVWLAPHSPFSKYLAPPIRYFFGSRVLHYPAHLWFIYHAMPYTHLIAATLVGAFLTGIACAMVRQAHDGQPLSLRAALVGRQVRYGRVVLLWLITWGLARGIGQALTHFAPKAPWMPWTVLGAALLLQLLLAYAIPSSVFEGVAWWRAIVRSIREVARHPLATAVVLAIPSAAMVLLLLIAPDVRVAQWMVQTVPEIAVLMVVVRLLIWTVADGVLTVAIAHLWWFHRASAPSAAPARIKEPQPLRSSKVITQLEEGPAVA